MQDAERAAPALGLRLQTLEVEADKPGDHRRRDSTRFRRMALLAPLAIMLVLWIWLFVSEGAFAGGPNGKTFEADFAMFLGAAKVMESGGNPYDQPTLYRTEASLLKSQGIPIMKTRQIVRVGNPPLLFWLLRPFTRLPFAVLGIIWMAILYLASAAGFIALIRHFGWNRWVLPLLFFLLMPQVAFGPFYGNVVNLVFAAVAFSIVLAARYPYAAGALLAFAWLKPPVALPIALLILLFQAPRRREMLLGFFGATAVGAFATLLATGWSTCFDWVNGLIGYTTYVGLAPDITSLSGLYGAPSPHTLRLFFELLTTGAALVLTLMVRHRRRRMLPSPLAPAASFLPVAWLWVIWFLATPYAHFFDEIMLAVPIVVLLGRNGTWVTRREAAIALYGVFASLLVLSASISGLQFLWLPLITVVLCVFIAGRSSRYILSSVT